MYQEIIFYCKKIELIDSLLPKETRSQFYSESRISLRRQKKGIILFCRNAHRFHPLYWKKSSAPFPSFEDPFEIPRVLLSVGMRGLQERKEWSWRQKNFLPWLVSWKSRTGRNPKDLRHFANEFLGLSAYQRNLKEYRKKEGGGGGQWWRNRQKRMGEGRK